VFNTACIKACKILIGKSELPYTVCITVLIVVYVAVILVFLL